MGSFEWHFGGGGPELFVVVLKYHFDDFGSKESH